MNPPVLDMDRTFSAPRTKVWRALTDQTLFSRWISPYGAPSEAPRFDPTPGGAYTVHIGGPSAESYTVNGVFEVVEPEQRLVITWDWAHSDNPPSRVSFVLTEVDGGTRLQLTHAGLLTDDNVLNHREGWTGSLGHLEALVTAA